MKPEQITRERVLRELAAIAFSDFTDFVRVSDGAVEVTDSSRLSALQCAAVAAIKDTGKAVELKLYDKQKALELLAKLTGIFDETPEEPAVRVELAPELAPWAE